MKYRIPFNTPTRVSGESDVLDQVMKSGQISGNGPFTKLSETLLSDMHQGAPTLLTTSGTHALEMVARILDLNPGDEVIVPSFTFVSTAAAMMWNGAVPVFADVDSDTLNLSVNSVQERLTDRTRAIVLVHYGGMGATPLEFQEFCTARNLILIEDNAHGLGGSVNGKTLGTFGSMSILSFHETKNITCGEGGALVLNDRDLVARAEILREKGTDRARFVAGQVDKYTWRDVGSSWIPSEILAALLSKQLAEFKDIQLRRLTLWERYHRDLKSWSNINSVKFPTVKHGYSHTGHLFHLRLPDEQNRNRFISHLQALGICAVFHYQALHESPFAKARLGRTYLPESSRAAKTLVRLPLYDSLTSTEQESVIEAVLSFRTG